MTFASDQFQYFEPALARAIDRIVRTILTSAIVVGLETAIRGHAIGLIGTSLTIYAATRVTVTVETTAIPP